MTGFVHSTQLGGSRSVSAKSHESQKETGDYWGGGNGCWHLTHFDYISSQSALVCEVCLFRIGLFIHIRKIKRKRHGLLSLLKMAAYS